jgi:DNA gyrase subunit B
LIELGTEEVSLVRLSDKKSYNKTQLMDVLVSLQELEKLSRAVTRRGAKFEDYLEARNAKSGDLPKYIAKVRKQTEETFEFLMDDKEVAKFRDKMGIEDEGDEDEKEEKGSKAKDAKEKDDKAKEEDKNRPKARIYEIYEASSISKVLQGLGKKGMAMDHFSAQDKPLFELIEGEGDKSTKTPIFSIAEILTGVKNVGKRGVQITRFKGLGEMDAKELFSTTMDPEKRQLLKVDLVDAAKADEIFTTLMGDEVEPRRIFIEENALNVRNLDI